MISSSPSNQPWGREGHQEGNSSIFQSSLLCLGLTVIWRLQLCPQFIFQLNYENLIILKIKYNLLILFFYHLNISFNLSHPSNHSQTWTNFTLNPPTFTFNLLKVNNTNFTLSTWCHPLPLHPINLEGERGKGRGKFFSF